MSGEIRAGGSWHTLTRGEIRRGGAWRTLTRGEVYKGGAWHQFVTFLSTLSVVDVPDDVSVIGSSLHAISLSSGGITVTPSGGLAPYSYSWAIIAPFGQALTLTGGTMATVEASATLRNGQTAGATLRATVTDSLGATATADASVVLQNDF